MSPRLGTLPFMPLSTTTKANSTRTTAAQKVNEQYNTIFTYMCSHRSPKMSYQLPYNPSRKRYNTLWNM